jgi:hypothetical protein
LHKRSFNWLFFKILLTEEEFQEFLKKNPDLSECIDCVECDDAPSITLE